MSAVGKSSVISELIKLRHRAIDLDTDEWSKLAPDDSAYADPTTPAPMDWRWREPEVQALLSATDDDKSFVAGSCTYQSRFYPLLDHVVLLTIPAAVAFATAMQSGSVVEGSVTGCPSERLMTRMPYFARFSMTHSIPAMTSLVHPVPVALRTRTFTSRTSGAMPPRYDEVTYFEAVLLPAMMPEICVPCP